MDQLLIFFAQYLFLLSCVVSTVYFLQQNWSQKKKILLVAVPAFVLAYLAALVASQLYFDPRPFVVGNFIPLIPHIADNGFPSDHALLVCAIASVATFLNTRLAFVLWIIALLVMAGRVYVGLHTVLDVGASVCITFASTLLVVKAMSYYQVENWKLFT